MDPGKRARTLDAIQDCEASKTDREGAQLKRPVGNPPSVGEPKATTRIVKRRARLSKRIRTLVEVNSGGKCCHCGRRGDHFHHLDGDPSNGIEDNIVLLCVRHHEEASRTSTMSRRLSADALRRERELLYQQVAVKRAVRLADPLLQRRGALDFDRLVEAVQVSRARELIGDLDTSNWTMSLLVLKRIQRLALEGGENIRSETLAAVEELTPIVRGGVPLDVVTTLTEITARACIQNSLFMTRRKRISTAEQELLIRGAVTMFSLIHDGALYLRDLRVVARASEVLGWILRYARVNGIRKVEQEAMTFFEQGMQSAARHPGGPFDDARRWLLFQRDDALALSEAARPDAPSDLFDAAWASD